MPRSFRAARLFGTRPRGSDDLISRSNLILDLLADKRDCNELLFEENLRKHSLGAKVSKPQGIPCAQNGIRALHLSLGWIIISDIVNLFFSLYVLWIPSPRKN